MSMRSNVLAVVSAMLLSLSALAQDRAPDWEFGGDIIYQDAQQPDFEGGSTIDMQTDWGMSITGGYRFNPLSFRY